MNICRQISSAQHPLIKHLIKLHKDNVYRNKQQKILLEGSKPIQEIQDKIANIFYTPSYSQLAHSLSSNCFEITEAILHKISELKTPEGLIAEVHMPLWHSLKGKQQVIVFDRINDPGNMGTLMRTALAFGWSTIYFLPECCDPFNPKVLRAARGAHFKLSLVKGSLENLHSWIESEKVQALAAHIAGVDPKNISSQLDSPRLLALGNEAQGVSKNLRKLCIDVTLLMPGEMESLNVAIAGGILMYVLSPHQSTLRNL